VNKTLLPLPPGKGVGKSTVTANFQQPYKDEVGILDADIYGPLYNHV
jgi:Mrp family chromosome partitioning ATPase